MKCAQIHPNLGAFVLGGLEPEEAAEVRRHLAFCANCRNELQELEKISQALEAAPPPVNPPDYLKGEILSRVRGEEEPSSEKGSPTSKAFRFALPAVAALVAVVALGVFFDFRAKAPMTTVQLIPTPELQEELSAEGEEYWGVAELHPQPSGRQLVELKLNNLEEPAPGNFYEMWLVSGEKHVSAGTFTTAGSGETRVWLTAPPKARNYRTLLITEESPAGGAAPGEKELLKGEVP